MRVAIAVLGVLLLAPAAAAGQGLPQVIEEGLREQSCRALVAGSGGAPDEMAADPVSSDLPATWAPAPAGSLPARVDLRTATTSFNRLYEFAVGGGRLYARGRGTAVAWRLVPLPLCFDGRLAEIAVDDDELIGLDAGRRIYTMDNALKDPLLWNWTSRWGTPFWLGPGFALPVTQAWSWTVISKVEDHNWTDPAGNRTAIGDGKVSHIWGLRPGGQRLTFWDPWLPLDESYEMCGPLRGRFRAVNLSTSGSEIFVIGERGDMFTRLYDFDLSGHDDLFFSYAYEDQRGKGDGAPIQLPAAPWVAQPKIPGAITSTISVHKEGVDALHRVLRVEGAQGATTGYWERDVASPASAGWTFHATGMPLTGRMLDNPARDTSAEGQGDSEDTRWVMHSGSVDAVLEDFNVYCSPARLRVVERRAARDELLHSVDGLRQQVRARGLDHVPRVQNGAIEGPKGRFTATTVTATRSEVVIDARGWRFTPAPLAPAARCLPAKGRVARRSIGPLRLGQTALAALRVAPIPTKRTTKAWRWCVTGGGRVTGAVVNGRIALLGVTARGYLPAKAQGRRLARGLRRVGPGRVAGVRGGRVGFVAVATAATLRDRGLLRKRLRAAGLRT
jgi:hypothetical protein